MDPKITAFLNKLPGEKLSIAAALRDLFLEYCPPLSESIKWNNLTFSQGKDYLVFIYTYKTTPYLNLGFLKATSLKDPDQLFKGTGAGMRHIKIHNIHAIPEKQVRKWIKESMALSKK
ncbi:MAG: DUF1801 domain-containing protein [Bacteroidia bacterium]|jgi:hypothetical protein